MLWKSFLAVVRKNALVVVLIPLLSGVGAALIAQHELESYDNSLNAYYGYKQSIPASLGAYAPYAFMEKGGILDGYIIQLTRSIGREMRARIDIVSRKLDDTQEAAIIRDVDVVLCMVKTPTTMQSFDFTEPYAINAFTLIKRKDAPMPTDYREEINNGRFVFNTDGAYYELNGPLLQNVGTTSTAEDALRLIDNGTYDYMILENYIAQRILGILYLQNVVIAKETNEQVEYSFAVRKGNPDLLNIFSKGLDFLQQTGEFNKIQKRWVEERFLISESGRNTIMISILIGIGISLFVLVLFFIWTVTLQEEVGIRTAALSSEVEVRKKTEEQLLANQAQLIQADKLAAIGTLASGIAHEINNPNGLILLNISFLKRLSKDLLRTLGDTRRDQTESIAGIPYPMLREQLPGLLDDMEGASTRISAIVEDLKNFARSDSAEWDERFSLNEPVEAALRLLEHASKKATDRLEISLCPQLPDIYGSRQKIEQVAINLIINASQALETPEQGLFITTEWDRKKNEVLLIVRDEGRGIPKENIPLLLDPFFTTKRETGGTGLGLSISDTIIKAHGGRMDIQSEVGVGTTVTLHLPVAGQVDENEHLS